MPIGITLHNTIKNNLFFYFLIFFIFSIPLSASHIVGGEITYTFVDFNASQTNATFEVTMHIFRDPLGIDFDPEADFGIFRQKDNGEWESYQVIEDIIRGPIINIAPISDPCKTVLIGDDKLESTSYTFNVTLEIGNSNYMIAYQKCCRNYSINNVLSVGDIGAVYDIVITPEAQRLGNSSPQFNFIAPQYICANFDLSIDHSATDIDGDLLIYKFCSPFIPKGVNDISSPDCCGCINPNPSICAPPYDSIIFINPYSAENPIGGNPNVNINTSNGFITGTPNTLGAYVAAICVEEYRNGILLSSVRRDFEFNVITCRSNLTASIQSDSTINLNNTEPVAYFESCGQLDFTFDNTSTDELFIDNYSWIFYDENQMIIYENNNATRDLEISFPEPGLYDGHMVISNQANCFDTAFIQVNIPTKINLDFDIMFDSCIVGPVEFINLSIPNNLDFNWTFGDNNTSTQFNPIHTYQTRGTYPITLSAQSLTGCGDTLETSIAWTPFQLLPPDTITIDTTLCYQDSIFIYDQWIYSSGLYYDYIPSLFSGCDSIVQIFNIDFTNVILPTFEYVELCDGESINFNNMQISNEGIYMDTLLSLELCDSMIVLQIDINESSSNSLNENICLGSFYNFNGLNLNEAGIYFDTLQNFKGCDSIIELNLKIDLPVDSTIYQELCAGGTFRYNDDSLTESGTYDYTFISSSGCDSTVYVTIEIKDESVYEFQDTICFGETYAFGEIDLSLPGLYYDTLANVNGCDSLIILDLIVGQNLSQINVDNEIVEEYGSTIYLNTELNGESLISNIWTESDSLLSNSLELQYLITEDGWIYFESVNGLFCIAKDSISIKSTLDKNIYIPNIFSPNSDNLNDRFYLGADASLIFSKLNIYDRWGNSIYVGKTISEIGKGTGWDGTYQSKNVEIGCYTYMFELEFINGDKEIRSGTIQLIR